MGKEEIHNFFCLIGNILNFFLQKCLLSSPLRFILILSKSVNLMVVGAAKRVDFCKNV